MTASRSLVLFDIDGTLLRGAGSHHKDALVHGIHRITGETTSFEGVDTAGMLDRDLIATLLSNAGVSPESITRTVHRIIAECQQTYLENCRADLSPHVCRGAREVLSDLQAHGAALGLVTGNLSEIGWRKMELAGLRQFFSLGAFSEDGDTRAQLARVAADRARRQRLAAEDCRISLIGDHRNDVEAARANGFQAVAVASGMMASAELRRFNPDILVESLADLDVTRLL